MLLKKLRRRMVALTMVIVSIVLALSFGLILHFTQASLERESLATMAEIANKPGRLGESRPDFQEELLPYFTVEITRENQLIARGGGSYDLSDPEFLQQVTEAALNAEADSGVLDQYELRYYRRLQGPRCVVFADISGERQTLQDLLRTCLLIGGAGFAAFLLLSVHLARRAVRPVEEAWQQQRQFVGDASHELKTPLTVIMTNAELLQDENCQPAARRRFTESILAMSAQMRDLVENLLELARVDNGLPTAGWETVDLSALTEEALLPFEALFFEKGLTLESDIAPGLLVRGVPARLKQTADVLLDNAQSYASPGGLVRVSLSRQGKTCRLTVANSGEPIPEAERLSIFKRFYRADKARSLSRHYGLGLPIAQGIVESHKGRIWADSRDGMNCFTVEMPLLT